MATNSPSSHATGVANTTTAQSSQPRSDFYVLPSADVASRERFLYKLLERISPLGRRIYIRTDSEASARALDRSLWDYRPEAFLPHALVAAKEPVNIEIGYGDALPEHTDVYINLALEVPEQALRFNRTIEIVVQQDDILTATRANYRRYQQSGYEIHMNDMRPKG